MFGSAFEYVPADHESLHWKRDGDECKCKLGLACGVDVSAGRNPKDSNCLDAGSQSHTATAPFALRFGAKDESLGVLGLGGRKVESWNGVS